MVNTASLIICHVVVCACGSIFGCLCFTRLRAPHPLYLLLHPSSPLSLKSVNGRRYLCRLAALLPAMSRHCSTCLSAAEIPGLQFCFSGLCLCLKKKTLTRTPTSDQTKTISHSLYADAHVSGLRSPGTRPSCRKRRRPRSLWRPPG